MDTRKIQHLMSMAAVQAMDGMQKGHGGPFGALICRDEEPISLGHNSVFLLTDPTAHAEITAIRQACQKLGRLFLDDCVLISTCEPCPMCLSAIFWARIPQVIYSSTRQDAEEIGFIDHHIYRAIQEGHTGDIQMNRIEHPDCQSLFKFWQNYQQKRLY